MGNESIGNIIFLTKLDCGLICNTSALLQFSLIYQPIVGEDNSKTNIPPKLEGKMKNTLGSLLFGTFLLTTQSALALDALVTAPLNFRDGPSVAFAIRGTIPAGSIVGVRGCSGNWCQINYGPRIGWASATYLAFRDGRAVYDSYNRPSYPSYSSPTYNVIIGDGYYYDDDWYYRRYHRRRHWHDGHRPPPPPLRPGPGYPPPPPPHGRPGLPPPLRPGPGYPPPSHGRPDRPPSHASEGLPPPYRPGPDTPPSHERPAERPSHGNEGLPPPYRPESSAPPSPPPAPERPAEPPSHGNGGLPPPYTGPDK